MGDDLQSIDLYDPQPITLFLLCLKNLAAIQKMSKVDKTVFKTLFNG